MSRQGPADDLAPSRRTEEAHEADPLPHDSRSTLPFFTADDVARRLPLDRAMLVIERALTEDPAVDPESDGPRLFSPAPGGEFLLMPAQGPEFSGLKALTVSPGNPARGLEKIQGLYLLYSSDTLAPIAVLDGASLTAVRTPAVTISAVRKLATLAVSAEPIRSPRLLVFGAGVQAGTHIRAAAIAFPGATFRIAARRSESVDALIAALRVEDETKDSDMHRVDADGRDRAVAEADIIICVTSSSVPVLDGTLVRDDAIVAAVGTHGRGRREVDDALVHRSDIVVEGRGSARRENGNLISLSESDWTGDDRPANLRELMRGGMHRTPGRPAFYTGVGMSWEDLICATAVFAASSEIGV